MYNLLMQYMAWEGGRGSVSESRLFEYTDDDVKAQFKLDDAVLLDKLTQLPCLFMQEGTQDELAHVGTIARARHSGAEILIEYSFHLDVRPIPNKMIFSNKHDFGMPHDFEFRRTHWAVKDVDLFRALVRLSQPVRQRPKVFTIPDNETIEPTLASVMMPFDASFRTVYDAVQEAATKVGLKCRRADEIWENPAIIQDIVTLIDKSFVVICDCTGRNPNVFYEIGIAHSLGREVILITQAEADVPFDLRHLRYVKYLNNSEGRRALKATLMERLRFLQENL